MEIWESVYDFMGMGVWKPLNLLCQYWDGCMGFISVVEV